MNLHLNPKDKKLIIESRFKEKIFEAGMRAHASQYSRGKGWKSKLERLAWAT